MSRDEFEKLKSGVIKRKQKRKLGLFIDGVGLDRATRRIDKRIDLTKLVSSLTNGLEPEIARYYTLIPHEDDARQLAFLDAVQRAGLEVVVKRLPPKNVKRQVAMDVHISCDLIGYSMGVFQDVNKQKEANSGGTQQFGSIIMEEHEKTLSLNLNAQRDSGVKRIAAIVCPTRELTYAIYMSHLLEVETSLVDFGLYGQSEGWRGIDHWVDLSTSETIWR
ncbi:MAG: hypothetical protein IT292_05320 [Deltaproteobacteria bacterium]|nr:hypothetical protein [Deltaproteobacteria bacterium]